MLHEIEIAPKVRRKPVTLTIREDILRDAKAFELNTSQAAEAGIAIALRKARGEAWLAENAEAIEAYNAEIRERGIAIPPLWGQIGV
jgi:antitoxin CcdA